MRFLLHFLFTALFIWLLATYYGSNLDIVLAGTGSSAYMSALIFAVVLAVVNLILGTLLRIIGMPLNILTLGLFSFVVTLIVIGVTDHLYDGIKIGDGTFVGNIISYTVIACIPVLTSVIVGKVKR